MTILVVGATSFVGNHLVRRLSADGQTIRCMTRIADNFKQFPPQAQGCVGDLEKPATLRMAFDGVDQVFLMTPLHPQEDKLGLAAVKAAVNAKVNKLVYMSVQFGEDSDRIPHFRRKKPVEKAIVESGIPYTILRPNNFFQNDYWCEAAVMLYNVYPQPLGNKGINRVDARDVAGAAAAALMDSRFDGQSFDINGPDTLTADGIAAQFSKILGRTIHYGGDDLNAWAKQAKHMMPEWMVSDLKVMYEYLQKNGARADDAALKSQVDLVDKPRTFAEFVEEIIPEWEKEHGQQ